MNVQVVGTLSILLDGEPLDVSENKDGAFTIPFGFLLADGKLSDLIEWDDDPHMPVRLTFHIGIPADRFSEQLTDEGIQEINEAGPNPKAV